MRLERKAQIAGWAFKLLAFILYSSTCLGQASIEKKSFGIAVTSGSSGSVYAVSVVYAGAPFFSDLQIVNEKLSSYSIDLFKNYTLKKHLVLEQSIGYSFYGYITRYNYDLSTSINNIVSDKRTYNFIDLSHRLKQDVRLSKKFSAFCLVGLSFNYLTKSSAEYENFIGGMNQKALEDRIDKEARVSIGYEVGIGFQFDASDNLSLQIRSDYSKLLNKYNNDERRLYSFGIGPGAIVKF